MEKELRLITLRWSGGKPPFRTCKLSYDLLVFSHSVGCWRDRSSTEQLRKETHVKHHTWVAVAGLFFVFGFFVNPVELGTNGQTTKPAYKDTSLPIEKRV